MSASETTSREAAIRVAGLSKRYRLGVIGARTFRDELSRAWSRFRSGAGAGDGDGHAAGELWALRDVTFDVSRGEVLGVIGKNGAGKSTLLKVLTRITEPTEGTARLYGHVASLIEVGTGFHPELTGRENIFLNGAILGMGRNEIQRKLDDIVAFSGVAKFIDTPVKRYSSGMRVRLGFAVAAHLDPEILLIDEVLAVGDAEFQRRCLGKMEELSGGGRTVIFVSHNMASISNLCRRVLVLDQGRVMFDGDADEGIRRYLDRCLASSHILLADRPDRRGNGALRFQSVSFRDPASGRTVAGVRSGDHVEIVLEYHAGGELRNVEFSIGLHGATNENIAFLSNHLTGDTMETAPGRGVVRCTLRTLPLLPGCYAFNICARVNGEIADWIQEAGTLDVHEGDYYGTGRLPHAGAGRFLLDHAWSVEAAGQHRAGTP